ncbi:DUF4055 domain-containing protein [Gellertiella hungarica]|uniref:DUF4055 domain-containing protein n=1 Tax=Gellertiella hungarica TaxID=1572859 RepID=A0A7W6J2Q1_9HYPH|nr:DUF4055 domain-containing protein [Gellertiella hungarica]MBB4063673.1 hypothetical protein [Gellertiella hungarica]
MIRAIRRGAAAIREAGEKYLLKFPSESKEEYSRRLKSSPWRPEFMDSLQTLSAKPFTKEVKLAEDATPAFEDIAQNIDGQGNNLHVFAKDVFEGAVSMGAHGILVDFPTGTGAVTLAQERAQGVRPYWVPINADDILEVTTEQRGASRVVTYLRIKESRIEKTGFEQRRVPLIREIEPGAFRVWREEKRADKTEWVLDSEGAMTLDEVPFVFFATADKEGDQYVRPPLLDLADIQIELYNALSKKEQTFTIAASPMLTANGMAAPDDDSAIETGPGRVLYAPGGEGVNASWDYIQPNAANLKEIREDIREIIEDMRRIGMQPMTQKSGNTPALAFQFDGEKSFTVLQSWALGLKDALEQAFVFTAKWMKSEGQAPSVMVHTDFAVGLYGAQEVNALLEARKEAQISQETFWDEMQRRGVLGPQFDREAEKERLAIENPPFDPEGQLDPVVA